MDFVTKLRAPVGWHIWAAFAFFTGLLLSTGCQNDAVRDDDVALMADLECQARQLKEQRFAAANRLRVRDDSLMKANVPITAAQVAATDSLKQALTLQTSTLATRLTAALDSLFETRYKTAEAREAFDQAMAQKVQEICP